MCRVEVRVWQGRLWQGTQQACQHASTPLSYRAQVPARTRQHVLAACATAYRQQDGQGQGEARPCKGQPRRKVVEDSVRKEVAQKQQQQQAQRAAAVAQEHVGAAGRKKGRGLAGRPSSSKNIRKACAARATCSTRLPVEHSAAH